MFWNKKKEKKRVPTSSPKAKNSDSRKNDPKAEPPTRSTLIQRLFSNGCDSDFVYYDE